MRDFSFAYSFHVDIKVALCLRIRRFGKASGKILKNNLSDPAGEQQNSYL